MLGRIDSLLEFDLICVIKYIRVYSKEFSLVKSAPNMSVHNSPKIQNRHLEGQQKLLSLSDIDYQEDISDTQLVQFDSGVETSYAIAWSHQNGFTGLQWYAGIPGTLGGALYNNIHGGSKHLSDIFYCCEVLIEEDYEE